MNERIGKLAVEAGAHWEHGDWNMPSAVYFSERDLEKFAELIVQECAELAKKKAFIIMQKAEEYAADKEEMINATSAAFHLEILEQEIRKHFGVEDDE
jgi:tRNA U54 and U55 pseudouridine synthase Pus10